MLKLSASFKEKEAPETGRRVVQLTSGNAFCYPLYYFIPTITRDERFLIYHRTENNAVQLYRLEFETGESIQLTNGTAENVGWEPWCLPVGRGILDHRSVLNVARNQVIYFDEIGAHQIEIDTLNHSLLFKIPEEKLAIGQSCVIQNGRYLAYILHDRATYAEMLRQNYWGFRPLSQGTELFLYDLAQNEHRLLVRINSPIHHVLPFGEKHLVFCHPCTENGMLLTDLNGGWYTHLRTQDEMGGTVCHYIATEKGLMYEVSKRSGSGLAGIMNPFTHVRFEFALPPEFGYTHTGCDPAGRCWFYESQNFETGIHDLHFLKGIHRDNQLEWQKLFGNWPTFAKGQRAHFHPRLTPDRQWILFTAGDPATQTNHIHLLDVSDLQDTAGINFETAIKF